MLVWRHEVEGTFGQIKWRVRVSNTYDKSRPEA